MILADNNDDVDDVHVNKCKQYMNTEKKWINIRGGGGGGGGGTSSEPNG